jgi:HD-GYP domain-containing protein (c-di-GMP phosphodiesterase class II)
VFQSEVLAAPMKEFIRIPTCILQVLDKTCVDLYLQYHEEPTEEPVLYRDAGYPLSKDRAQGLAKRFQDTLYVSACDYASFSRDLANYMEEAFEKDVLQPLESYELLQYAVSVEIEQTLRMVQSDEYVHKTQSIGRQISRLLAEEKVLPIDLFQIVRHDFQTFVHVTNVAGYATLLAKELGICDSTELEKIAVGGLLHDLGKRHIPRSILNKTEVLTRTEWEIIQQHPQRGYEELCHRNHLEHGQLMMVYQHHEHVNGAGYPVGILGNEIHPWARLLAVVDVFDALTGERPYRIPNTPEQAIEFLTSRAGTQFDEEMVQCWASAMTKR